LLDIAVLRCLSSDVRQHDHSPMKRCSYCDAEYPDNVGMCSIDHTALGRTRDLSAHKFKGWPHVLVAACCGLGMTFLSFWLLGRIPLSHPHSILREIVERSMIAPIFLATHIDPDNGHRFTVWCSILLFIQWSAVGFGLFSFVHKSRHHNDAA
jgi:hypothetical protein